MSTPQKAGFGELLSKIILPKVHLIALLVSAIGLVFKYMNLSGSADILMIGFPALAAVYFLSAFTMVVVAQGSKHSPYALILFKLLYIAAAVSIGVSVLASAALVATNPDNMTILKRPLFIGIPLCLISGYFLYYASTH